MIKNKCKQSGLPDLKITYGRKNLEINDRVIFFC